MKLQLYLLLLTAMVLGTSMDGARVYGADKEHAEEETETPLTGAWGGGDRWGGGGDGGDRWHGGGGGDRWHGGGRKW
ncbi:hypothetical protein SprV_0602077900 [Sparganum proliferum]